MRIAIVGAGIAGLTAAIALAQRGFSVELLERAPALTEIGAGIQLSPNAMAVLDRLGVAPMLEGAVAPQAIEIRDALSGGGLTRIPLGPTAVARYGAPYCLMHRADLQAALLAVAGRHDRILIRPGVEVREVSLQAQSVALRTSEGSLAADVAVGADGIHSLLRTQAFGHPGAQDSGRHALRATLPAERVPRTVPMDATGLWLGPGAHLVHYPLRSARELNVVVIARGPPAGAPPGGSFGPPLRELVEAIPAWTPWPLTEVDPTRPWVAGRAVLIGDAAHAMLPTAAQGGAQAIEDAWVLAQSLADQQDRPQQALAAHARARRARVERVVREARRNLLVYNLSGAAAAARNLAIRALPPQLHLARLDWLFGWKPPQKP